MLKIDGSHGEGGGAVLRLATGMSVCTETPVKVVNIRKGRPNPGLATQHLVGLRAARDLCGAKLKGAKLGSTKIEFIPDQDWTNKLEVDIKTAGSVGLVLQVLQIASVFAPHPVEVDIKGGASYGKWAPPLDYIKNLTFKVLEDMAYKINLKTERHGFYPVGGCRASAVLKPAEELDPIKKTKFGEIKEVKGISIATRELEGPKVADRQREAAEKKIAQEIKAPVEVESKYVDADCPGSGIVLWAETDTGCLLGSDYIGEKGLKSEIVGNKAAEGLLEEIERKNTVDRYLADQIIPFMALCGPPSKYKFSGLTSHGRTNVWVCEQFLDRKFAVSEKSVETSP